MSSIVCWSTPRVTQVQPLLRELTLLLSRSLTPSQLAFIRYASATSVAAMPSAEVGPIGVFISSTTATQSSETSSMSSSDTSSAQSTPSGRAVRGAVSLNIRFIKIVGSDDILHRDWDEHGRGTDQNYRWPLTRNHRKVAFYCTIAVRCWEDLICTVPSWT